MINRSLQWETNFYGDAVDFKKFVGVYYIKRFTHKQDLKSGKNLKYLQRSYGYLPYVDKLSFLHRWVDNYQNIRYRLK